MTWINKLKDLYNEHNSDIFKGLSFIEKTSAEIVQLSELKNKNIFSYINTGLKTKNHYQEIYKNNLHDYFNNSDWEPLDQILNKIIIDLIEAKYLNSIKFIMKDGSLCIYQCSIEGVLLGWIVSGDGDPKCYVRSGKKQECYNILKNIFWNSCQDFISVDVKENKYYWNLEPYLNLINKFGEVHKSYIVEKYYEHILKFKNNNFGRAIIFYGPPGTGKSNICKYIATSMAKEFNFKILKFNKIEKISGKMIVYLCTLLDPDIILMDDVDHFWKDASDDLLDKIEELNKRGKILLATANNIGKVNSALIRPGRFDELIEINSSDEETVLELIDNAKLYDKVKSFPLAFIVEVAKRYKSLGEEETLKSLNDVEKRVLKYNSGDYVL